MTVEEMRRALRSLPADLEVRIPALATDEEDQVYLSWLTPAEIRLDVDWVTLSPRPI